MDPEGRGFGYINHFLPRISKTYVPMENRTAYSFTESYGDDLLKIMVNAGFQEVEQHDFIDVYRAMRAMAKNPISQLMPVQQIKYTYGKKID